MIPKLDNPQSSIVGSPPTRAANYGGKGDATRAYQGASLAVRGTHAVYFAADSLICLDRQTGAERWRVPCTTSGGRGQKTSKLTPGTTVSLVLADDAVYLAADKTLTAFAMKDGARLGPARRT